MRLFIAIQLNEKMKDSLVRMQNAMKRQGVTGNCSKRENLHLQLNMKRNRHLNLIKRPVPN